MYFQHYHNANEPKGQRKPNPKSNNNSLFHRYERFVFISISETGYEPAITAFYDAELELRKYCTEFASQVDFKYNQDILNDLTQFVEVSLSYDVRNAVLGNMTMRLGEKTYIEVIQDFIVDSEHDWVSEIHNKNNSNMMAPYVCPLRCSIYKRHSSPNT